jgi:DamX protein
LNNYTKKLQLAFDPFEPGANSHDFFAGGNRQELLDRVLKHLCYSSSMVTVQGCLGAGKTTLANWCCERFGDEAVCTLVTATLFMNRTQFLEKVQQQLSLNSGPENTQEPGSAVRQLADQLLLEAKSLIVVVDDAHELGSDVFEEISDLLTNSNIKVLLLGESQLGSLLANTLSDELYDRVAEFELDNLGSDDIVDYLRFKLANAGYSKPIPVAGGRLGELCNSSNGVPGAINALIADELDQESVASTGDVATLTLTNSGVQYWAVAGLLLVLLAAVIIFQDSVIEDEMPVASSEVKQGSDRIQIPVSIETTVDDSAVVVAAVQSNQPVDIPVVVASSENQSPEPVVAAAEVELLGAVRETSSPRAPQSETNPPLVSEPALAVVAETPVASVPVEPDISAFEQALLSFPSDNFTVQVMGSRSESSVQEFVQYEADFDNSGYFETRFQDRPWFVVVLGNFEERNAAVEAIDDLPQSLRTLQPWIRTLGDIQSDIRRLHASN